MYGVDVHRFTEEHRRLIREFASRPDIQWELRVSLSPVTRSRVWLFGSTKKDAYLYHV